jgi:hypothetical protein
VVLWKPQRLMVAIWKVRLNDLACVTRINLNLVA